MENFVAKRVAINKILTAISVIFAIFGLGILLWILATLIFKGIGVINLEIFSSPTAFGGLANALLGQLMIVFFASIFGIFFGLMGGIYLSQYAKNQRLANLVRNISDTMISTPSIVIGVIAYAIFVKPTNSYSGWAGSAALGIMMIPIILKVTDDTLNLIPKTLREASFALGANNFQTITKILFRVAKTGLITGIILAIARVCGETAPLLFTSANNDFFSINMNKAMPSLSVSIYDFSQMPDENLNALAWAGALILTIFVLGINIFVRFLTKK